MPTIDADPSRLSAFRDYRSSRDRTDRNRLVEEHLGLAEHLARKFASRGEQLDDLVQVASEALVKAVERFEPDRGWEFTTFAVPTILGELKRHFRDKTWAVRVPRRMQELHLRIGAALAELTAEVGRSPTIPELAERLGVEPGVVLEGMEAGRAYRTTSLDAVAHGDDEEARALSDRLGGPDVYLDEATVRNDLKALLADLPPRERNVVILRFFGGLTQAEIAERVGVSQMQVSRLLARTLAQLRAAAVGLLDVAS